MNANTFRLVFSKRLGMLVPVAEQTSSHVKGGAAGEGPKQGRQGSGAAFLFKSIAFGVAMAFASPGFSLPTDPTVMNGTATFNQVGNVLTVTNSNKAIIDWQKFSIAAGETTRFLQGSASSSVLNRVLTNNPSQIYGTLSSNGQVWLINQSGIMVGPGALIDTAGFVGSTLNVRAEDFLAGRLNFQATPGAGSVVNQGSITTPAGGSVYLVGPSVSNEGIINAPNGEVILAAGATVNLIDTATPGVKVEITGADNNATNLGTIVAEAGRIGIAGAIVRNSGTLDASSVVNDGGRIFLKASQDTYVDQNGRIVATGTKGGQVEVLGNRVAVTDNASIDVSGTNGGGTILVGGDYQGKNPEIQNASVTYFGPNASLKANATGNGDGGRVIVWADDATRAYGTIEAKGGAHSGNGGFVETSGMRRLDVEGIDVNTGGGTWLLDPTDMCIYGTGASCTGFSSTMSDATLTSGLLSNNVLIETSGAYYGGSGNILFDHASVDSSSATAYGLSVLAFGGSNAYGGHMGDINIYNSTIKVGGGVTMVAGWNGGYGVNNPAGNASNAQSTPGFGNINIGQGGGTDPYGYVHPYIPGTLISGGNVTLKAGRSITIDSLQAAGSVTANAYYSIGDNNWQTEGTPNITVTGGASTVSLSSTMGVDPMWWCGIDGCDTISLDIAGTPYTISASVSSSATSGGIGIRYLGVNTPMSVSLSDYSTNPNNNYTEFFRTQSFTAGSWLSLTSYGGLVFIGSDGDLTLSGANISGSPVEIDLYSGGILNVSQALTTSYNASNYDTPLILMAAGTAININSALTSGNSTYGGDIGLVAGVTKEQVKNTIDTVDSALGFMSAFSNATGTVTINANMTAGDSIGVAAGNIAINSGKTVQTYGDGIFMLAGNTLDMNGTLYANYGNIGLVAGSTVNVNGTVSAGYDIGIIAGGGAGFFAASTAEEFIGSIASLGSAINIGSSGHISAGYSVGMLAGDIKMTGGSVYANDSVIAVAGNNIELDSGASIMAGYEVYLALAGGNSMVSLNNGSTINAESLSTIYIDFLGRTAGGVSIDGVETTTSPGINGSGFYNLYSPAVLGDGLIISYYGTPLVIEEVIKPIDPCLLTPEACQIDTGGLADLTGTGDQSSGGGEGQFGEGENKGKGKKSGMCKG